MAQQPYPNRGSRPFQQRDQDDDYNLDSQKSSIKSWVQSGIDKSTVSFADEFGKFVAKNELTTSQIRTAFGEMRRIQMNDYKSEKTSFILLKPKLAYAVKRHNKAGLKKFYEFFSIGYDAVDTSNDDIGRNHFNNLMNIMEAVLAYHKYHGGKE